MNGKRVGGSITHPPPARPPSSFSSPFISPPLQPGRQLGQRARQRVGVDGDAAARRDGGREGGHVDDDVHDLVNEERRENGEGGVRERAVAAACGIWGRACRRSRCARHRARSRTHRVAHADDAAGGHRAAGRRKRRIRGVCFLIDQNDRSFSLHPAVFEEGRAPTTRYTFFSLTLAHEPKTVPSPLSLPTPPPRPTAAARAPPPRPPARRQTGRTGSASPPRKTGF